jgi:hypothetical protein
MLDYFRLTYTLVGDIMNNIGYSHKPGFYNAFKVIEKFQVTAFCIQEFIISGIFTKEAVGFLHIMTQKGGSQDDVRIVHHRRDSCRLGYWSASHRAVM